MMSKSRMSGFYPSALEGSHMALCSVRHCSKAMAALTCCCNQFSGLKGLGHSVTGSQNLRAATSKAILQHALNQAASQKASREWISTSSAPMWNIFLTLERHL
eukprot:163703-Amphidinium_carterae.1